MNNVSVQESLDVFCSEMNNKAKEMRLTSTEYRSPCGNGDSTAADIVKCLINVNKYPELLKIWGTPRHTFNIDGENPRNLTVVSTIFEEPEFAQLEKYNVLGGKTGTLTKYGAFNLSFIAEIPDSTDKVLCVILYADEKNSLPNNRFKAARQAMDAAVKKYLNPDCDVSDTDVCADSACVALLPESGEDAVILFEKNSDDIKYPASVVKITTAMVALDNADNTDFGVHITQDVIDCISPGFRGDDFKAGDVVKLQDLLYAMMLPSSNIASYVVGSYIGSEILRKKKNNKEIQSN